MKPIETFYNGYRFRSRLEARWAVFMSTLFVPFQYEVEGFQMGNRRYLPDFWLEDQKAWLEIKPRIDGRLQLSPQEAAKLIAFQDGLENGPVPTPDFWIVAGDPYPCEYDTYLVMRLPSGDWNVELYGSACWVDCPGCGSLSIQSSGFERDTEPQVHHFCCRRCEGKPTEPLPVGVKAEHGAYSTTTPETFTESHRLMRAYNAARSARF